VLPPTKKQNARLTQTIQAREPYLLNIPRSILFGIFLVFGTCTPHYVRIKKVNLILMQSPSFDLFQLKGLTLMQISCWLIETGKKLIVWIYRGGMQGEKGKLCMIYAISPSMISFFWNTTVA
jgi:hypothetical protein